MFEYKELVKKYNGVCYGRTDQSRYIEEVNKATQGKISHLIQFVSSGILRKNTFTSWDTIDRKGICNGLVQLLFLKVMSSSNKELAVKDFANRLDQFDLDMAKQAALFQSFDHSSYENLDHNNFRKTLGLDLEETKNFSPYVNEKINAWLENVQTKISKLTFFGNSHEPEASMPEQKTLTTKPKKKNSEEIINTMIDFIIHRPENDLVKISLNFETIEKYKTIESGAHAIFSMQFKDQDNKIKFIFYDPNALPTIFDDQAAYELFLKDYLNNQAQVFKNLLKNDDVRFTVSHHSGNANYFHEMMRELEKAIALKISELTLKNYEPEYIKKLEILKIHCAEADRNGKYHRPKIPSQIQDKAFVRMLESTLNKLFDTKRVFFSNKELIQMITEDIEKLKRYDTDFTQDLLNIISDHKNPLDEKLEIKRL